MTILAALLLIAAQNPWPEDTYTKHHPGLIEEMIYNPASIQTYTGKVHTVQIIPKEFASGQGVHLLLQTAEKVVSLRVGPQRYLDEIGLQFEQGEDLTATGSIVIYDGKEFMIPATITYGGKEYNLRKRDGTPLWKMPNYRLP